MKKTLLVLAIVLTACTGTVQTPGQVTKRTGSDADQESPSAPPPSEEEIIADVQANAA